jgi:uncharacterized membrane protein (UPF0127 family)
MSSGVDRTIMSFRIKFPRLAVLIALALAAPARAQDASNGQPQSLPVVDIHLADATLHTQIASSPHEEEVGLMYVGSLPDNDGMLFVLPLGTAQFWMKNTLIPLSIAFLDQDGTVLEIHDMKAMDESITRSDSDHVAYAIEANLHWFSLNEIKPGMKISPLPGEVLIQADAHAAAH